MVNQFIKTNKKGIVLFDFIDLLKEKLDCIKLTCTLNDTERVFSKCFGTVYEIYVNNNLYWCCKCFMLRKLNCCLLDI